MTVAIILSAISGHVWNAGMENGNGKSIPSAIYSCVWIVFGNGNRIKIQCYEIQILLSLEF